MKDRVTQVGDPVLRTTAVPVPKKDIGGRKLAALIKHMSDTLKHEGFGVAIAAPQVGESLRLFVVAGSVFEKDGDDDEKPIDTGKKKSIGPDRVFINPEITRRSRNKKEMSEGCLSVRGKYGTVMRHEKVTLKALTEKGEPVTYNGTGLLGHIFQHECDHLDGILYIDKTVRLEEDEDMKGARQKLKDKHGI